MKTNQPAEIHGEVADSLLRQSPFENQWSALRLYRNHSAPRREDQSAHDPPANSTVRCLYTHPMKTTLPFLVLVLSGFVALGADTATPSNAPPATITGVSAANDKRTLVIRYEISGHSHEQRVAFTNDITDFRYCRWLGERGIAVVASTRAGEFFYAAIYLKGRDVTVSPAKIPAPTGTSHLLGIANTSGDSIVITAVQHRRDGPDRLTGWMFIDNCPPIGVAVGLVVPFDLSRERSDQEK